MVCLALGTCLAVLGHFRGLELVGVFGPVVLTAAYPLWGWIRKVHLRPSLRERFADNAYYLGFIFTQVALLVGIGAPVILNRHIDGNEVLRFFGVAIGASMTGLVARTLLVQTGHTVTENADALEQGVEDIAREVEALGHGVTSRMGGVLSDLDAVAIGLAGSRERLDRELGAWVDRAASGLQAYDAQLRGQTAAFEEANAAVAGAAQRAGSGIAKEESLLVERIRATAESLDRLQTGLEAQVTEASLSIQTAGRAFSGGLAAVTELQANMRERMAEASDGIRVATQSLANGAEALQGLSALDGMVKTIDERVVRVGESIDQLGTMVLRGSAVAEGAGAASVAAIQASAEAARMRAQQQADSFAHDLDHAVDALKGVLEGFKQEMEKVRG